MRRMQLFPILFLCVLGTNYGQTYHIGFTTLQLRDSSRTYKPQTAEDHALHYRPVDLDIWYPSEETKGDPLLFGDLFQLFEKRAIDYQDNEDYTGLTNELASYYVAEMGVGTDGQQLLQVPTRTYADLEAIPGPRPVIFYLAGFNGMGFENYKVLERLAQKGYVVVAIWSVGRYPGDMTNEMADMMEQVQDAEFALEYLEKEQLFGADYQKIGLLGCSWGGMSSAVFVHRNPEVKAFVSLDGTETHYFGEADENDRFIQAIHDSRSLQPSEQQIDYLYLESGDKLEEFEATKVYNYFEKLNSEKYYLRFTNSTHADFSCIPSILQASESSVAIYADIEAMTLAFFEQSLRDKPTFGTTWETVKALDYTTEAAYDLSKDQGPTLELSGRIRDKNTKEPLPYVNIGVLNREVGTVTNTAGEFNLEIGEAFSSDTLRISSIGYQSIEIPVANARTSGVLSILLEEQISELNEVVLTAKAYKRKTLGNKTESRFLGTGFGYDQLGAEMGIKIGIRKKPTFADAFNFTVSHNRLSTPTIFRVNIYTVEKNKPKDNILTENILVTIDPKQVGKFTVDLRPYDIVLYEDAIVTLEWVDSLGENQKGEVIFFPLGLLTNGTIYKRSSQSKFKKYSSLGVGFNIDVRY